MSKKTRRAKSALGMWMIGKGVAYAMNPKGYIRLWTSHKGPHWYQKMGRSFIRHPILTGVAAGAGVATGMKMVAHAQRPC